MTHNSVSHGKGSKFTTFSFSKLYSPFERKETGYHFRSLHLYIFTNSHIIFQRYNIYCNLNTPKSKLRLIIFGTRSTIDLDKFSQEKKNFSLRKKPKSLTQNVLFEYVRVFMLLVCKQFVPLNLIFIHKITRDSLMPVSTQNYIFICM